MDATSRGSDSPRWYWIAAFWCGIGLFDATQNVFVMRAEGMHHYWYRLFFTLFIAWLPWAVATPLALRLSRRYPPTNLRQPSTWIAHGTACAVVGLAYATWLAMWESLLNPWAASGGPDPFRVAWPHKFYSGLLSDLILYSVILLVAHLLDSRGKLALQATETARLNEQLSKAQLNALRRQIEPHFLFNALNAIAGLVREERNDAAVTMVVELSDFLRRVVNDSERQQVLLSEELEFTRKYLDIQKARFADRLEFSVDVPEELLSAQVPSLILQPMVENGVKHGIAKRVQGGAIRISAAQANGMLSLRIYNEGPSLFADWMEKSGIGMENVRTRLESLYGKAFELTLRNHRSGVEAIVSLPYVAAARDAGLTSAR